MKKTLKWTFIAAVFATAVLFCSAALAEIASGTNGSITWSLSDDGLLTISGNGPMNNYEYAGSPWYGYRGAVTSVIIEENVTRIGKNAFRECSSLTGIEIPNSVTIIGLDAFADCSSLESITIPNSVTSIDVSAFLNCISLESITIPNSVTSISSIAFYGCTSLTGITIPHSVTSIGSGAFLGCSSLTGITIPNSVTSIESHTFEGCSSLTSITIPHSVTSIGLRAFQSCNSLMSAMILNSETTIGDNAFYQCSKNLTIYGLSGSSAESYAEANGIRFNSLSVMSGECGDSVKWVFEDYFGTLNIYGSGNMWNYDNTNPPWNDYSIVSVNIEDGVICIGSRAFQDCSSLTRVMFPNSVTGIGDYAFSGCGNLTGVTIPNSVTSIGDYAFSGCGSLTGIEIPNSVSSIGDYAFSGCSNLTGIEIPDSVTSIGNYAFQDCSSLMIVMLPNSVTSIGDYAFSGCSSLLNVTIPNSVTSIGNSAFSGCSSLSVINYRGTESGWEQIGKGSDWNTGTDPALQIFIKTNVSFTFSGGGNGSVIVTDSNNRQYTLHSRNGIQFPGLQPGTIHMEFVPDVFSRTGSVDVTVTRGDGFAYPVSLLDDNFQLDDNDEYYVKVAFTALLPGSGTAGNPWQIGSEADWNRVATAVGKGQVPAGKHFRLTDSISVSTMIGTTEHPFSGFFDGSGKTLTVSLTATSTERGPFACVGNAAFSHLRVAGSITTSYNDTGGLLGFVPADCTCTITDCVSDVDITASNGSGHAGFAGSFDGSVAINGCVFTGSIVGASTRYSSGFAGAGGGTVDNSVYDGTISEGYATNTFLRQKDRAENCYYMNANGIQRIKGRQGWAVTTDSGVIVDFGTPVAIFPTSGITTYPTGLVYDGQFYAGADQNVTFSLSAAGAGPEFHTEPAADGVIFTEGANGRWTLTMPAQAVTIGANLLRIFGPADFTLPAGLAAVDDEAFAGIAAEIVDIPAGCTYIGDGAFRNCPNLTQIRIPEGCGLGADVFAGCGTVCVFGVPGSPAESYSSDQQHNCVFVSEYYCAPGRTAVSGLVQ